MSKQMSHLYEFGPFRIDVAERQLLREGEAVPLTPKAFETLLLLVESAGHTVEKDELMRRLWPDTFVEEGAPWAASRTQSAHPGFGSLFSVLSRELGGARIVWPGERNRA